MKTRNEKSVTAKLLTFAAKGALSSAANSMCALCYHQPKQPEKVKEFRKF